MVALRFLCAVPVSKGKVSPGFERMRDGGVDEDRFEALEEDEERR